MRLVNINYLKENSILAQPIMDSLGRILLSAGVNLNTSYIERLRGLGYQVVYIEDERLDDVEIQSAISDKTRIQAFKTLNRINQMGEINQSKSVQNLDLKKTISQMINDILSCPTVETNLVQIRGHDNFTFHHSINTTVIALVIGAGLRYSEQQLLELGIGAMMHDIGKTKVPRHILDKKENLTKEELEYIKQHTLLGFQILKNTPDLGLISAHVALQHHEKWDGTGYPRGLKHSNIHEYARITSIADVYDALTSPRSYRDAFQPYEAYEFIIAKSLHDFDPKLVDVFSKNISVYPMGCGVRLSNGQSGNIIKQNPNFPSRPWIRIFYASNQRLMNPFDLNLIDHPSLMIKEIDNI